MQNVPLHCMYIFFRWVTDHNEMPYRMNTFNFQVLRVDCVQLLQAKLIIDHMTSNCL